MKSHKQILTVQVTTFNESQTYQVDKSEFIFGRSGKADVGVQDSNISRKHLKIKLENKIVSIMDLGSLNGTQLDGVKINPNEYIAIKENSVITFDKCDVVLKIGVTQKIEEIKTNVSSEREQVVDASSKASPVAEKPTPPKVEHNIADNRSLDTEQEKNDEKIKANEKLIEKLNEMPNMRSLIDLSAFPKNEEEHRLNFKNVGLNLPRYKNPGEHAKEIIAEAEYQKQAIIKNAEVFKSKTINEARVLSKKASAEAYSEYKTMVDYLLQNTRAELKKLQTDTEILLDEKRLQANEEIQKLWQEHEDHVRADRDRDYEKFEKENKIKLDLLMEKAKSDLFAERHKVLTDAESEIIQKKRLFQVEFENEKTEHMVRIKTYNDELLKVQENIENCKKTAAELKALKDDSELELTKIMSQLKVEKDKLEIVNNTFKDTEESHKVIEHELATFNETKNKILSEIEKTQLELQKLNTSFSLLTEKKQNLEEETKKISDFLADAKMKAKSEIENEYIHLKDIETKKFEDFKANELKDLQKIREAHSNSIKNFSVELSQAIATKLELLATKNTSAKFDFDKNFELINSVIQVKSAATTGSESKHAEQLESWKSRKRKENFSFISRGFVAGVICVFLGNAIYQKLNVDPVKEELARIAVENRKKDVENRFIPVRTSKYHDNYVEATLYTENFADTYLDKDNQREWVNHATRYFLSRWRVDEEKVIQVISNSGALVQHVNDMIPNMKNTKLKTDLANLKNLEAEYIQKQASILGTNVKYEAYKKLEKDFFQNKILGRGPANK